MAHNSIEPADDDRYNAGDAIDIPVHFYDMDAEQRIDLTGATVEFRVKEMAEDPDEEAILEKTADEDGEGDGDEITFEDPLMGEVVIHVETGDTEDFLEDGSERLPSKVFEWHCRVYDEDGRRVTPVWGEWEMWSV